jgi:hypothetical protein
MAKRTLSFPSVTTSAFADSANLTDGAYMCAMSGASTTQRTAVSEIYCGGLAPSASSPVIPIFSRAHVLAATVGATTTFDAPNDPGMAALAAPVVVGNFFTTKPQSGVNHLVTIPYNAFGGLSKWQCPVGVGAELIMYGNVVDIGAFTFAMFTGSTASTVVGGYVVYETQ